MQIELLAGSDRAVILDRVFARGLVMRDRERVAADLNQLRRGEELHVRRIPDDGVHECALVDDDCVESFALRFDRTGQSDGARADHYQVVHAPSIIMLRCVIFRSPLGAIIGAMRGRNGLAAMALLIAAPAHAPAQQAAVVPATLTLADAISRASQANP